MSYCIGFEEVTLTVKEVPVTISNPSLNFALDEIAVFSQSQSSDYANYTLGITNVSNEARCYVHIEGIQIRSAEGVNLLAADDLDFSYVEGSLYYYKPAFGNIAVIHA